MMTKLKESVKELVAQELSMASKDYGDRFHSAHEAYAVILEEYEEAKEELSNIEYALANFWGCVRFPDYSEDSEPNAHLSDLERTAINAACECIQIAAMARKAQVEYGDSKHE
jgi:hypothetical protein